jgi:hypothetical protein
MHNKHVVDSLSAPQAVAAKPWQARHDVQFYDDDNRLATTVAGFLAEGIKSAQPAIVIATPAHMRAIQDVLRHRGVDVESLGPNDMIWLDARDTLSAFMEGGRPSRELFDATVGNVFEKITNARRYVTVRAFGEMVDILWREGKTRAAIELEELWNGLASRYAFALLCAYSTHSLDPADLAGIERICSVHNQVLSAARL